jgi:Flp pilus assembly protein TadD
MGQPGDALQPLRNVIKLTRNDADAWINLGINYQELGLYNSAIRAFYKATRLNSSKPDSWKYLGDLYRSNKKLLYARKAYKTALKLDPQDNTVLYSLSTCYANKKLRLHST